MIDRDKLFCKRILMFLPKNVYYDGCRQNKLIACKMSENVVQRKGKFKVIDMKLNDRKLLL